jgi:hypothetical protein
MADVETAVALCEAAANGGSGLLRAQSRVRGAEIALGVGTRLLKLFAGSGLYDEAKLAELSATADLAGSVTAQAGVMADMDFIAKTISAA